MKYDLSILIPARNEMFVSNTVADILEHRRGATEVIVGLDGGWAEPGIPDHPDVRIVRVAQSIGQRGMTNQLARLSQAKYIAKCDAHCTFDEGFDVKLMEAVKGHDDWTVVPVMRNLHAFDWVCEDGHRRYQGPSGPCETCKKPTTRDILWIGKPSPQSRSYCFDPEPHFQYNNPYMKTQGAKEGIIIGYNLSFDKGSLSPSIVSFLTNFTNAHSLTSSGDSFSKGQDMTPNTMGLSSVDNSGSIGAGEVSVIGDKLEMQGITTSPVSTDMVNDGNMFSPASGNGSNQPGKGNTMSETFIVEKSTPTISPSIDPSNPIPAASSTIKSDVIDELNNILGGEFVYNEKTSSFHNNSVTLTLVRNKGLNYTMSLQGSFFMLTREKYWELDICNEDFGSWGSQGIEVACKTWLSGGEVMCVQTTWYAHMFRTQGGDFGFPYPQSGTQVSRAKHHAKNLFMKDRHGEYRWPAQERPLSWLVERFWPVSFWTEADLTKLKEAERG